MPSGPSSFSKAERLSGRKQIQELFERGSSIQSFPFRVLHMPQPDGAPAHHQVLISVSKRLFSRAVDRNYLKRRIREAYRTQKNLLPPPPARRIAFIFTARNRMNSAEILQGMKQALGKLGAA